MSVRHLMERAQRLYDNGQIDASIELLTRLLGEQPDDADAHALLSLCLVRRKRLHAAQSEARQAAALDPESAFAHLAMGVVLTASRDFKPAAEHLRTALALEPEFSYAHVALSRLYALWGQPRLATEHAARACALAPDASGHWAHRGWLAWQQGDRQEAIEYASTAVQLDPEDISAVVLLGHDELARGNVDAAREHVAWAQQNDPTDEDALALLGGIKARTSMLLGAWWRFQTYVASGSNHRALLMLVGMFLLYRVLILVLDDAGRPQWGTVVTVAWMGFCVYTWFAPTLFWKSVKRELETVRLRPDF